MQSLNQVLVAVGTGIALIIVSAVLVAGQLPDPGMEIDPKNTALVITDPQNDFLSPEGVTWGVVGKSGSSLNFPVKSPHGSPSSVRLLTPST